VVMEKDVEEMKLKLGDNFDSFVDKANNAGKAAAEAGFTCAQILKANEKIGKAGLTLEDLQNGTRK